MKDLLCTLLYYRNSISLAYEMIYYVHYSTHLYCVLCYLFIAEAAIVAESTFVSEVLSISHSSLSVVERR